MFVIFTEYLNKQLFDLLIKVIFPVHHFVKLLNFFILQFIELIQQLLTCSAAAADRVFIYILPLFHHTIL